MKKTELFAMTILVLSPVFADKERHGGFEYENSRKLLNLALSELYSEITSTDDSAFPHFNPDWNKEKLADLIKTTLFAYEEETTGINMHDQPEQRMFDYVQVGDVFFLRALRPYFEHYANIPVDETNMSFQEVLRDVKIKLIHEASHIVWKYNEFEADFYSPLINQKLENLPQNKKQMVSKSIFEYLRQQFIFSRPPTLAELRLNKRWTCWIYPAQEPDFLRPEKKYYSFSDAGGLLINFATPHPQNYVYSQANKALIS